MLGIAIGVNLGEIVSDDVEVSSGLTDRHAGLEEAERPNLHVSESRILGDGGSIQGERAENVGPACAEARWHDAYQSPKLAVEIEGFAQDFGVAVELLLPELVGRRDSGRENRGTREW